MPYMFNADLYHDDCIIEELISCGELAPAARDMAVDEALWQAQQANCIEEPFGSDEWPVSLSPQEQGEDDTCGRCLNRLEDDPPCDVPDPQNRPGFACVYRLRHSSQFPHRFQDPDGNI